MSTVHAMGLPDRIFALGGAGKEITLTLLEQDWVLEEVLKPRPNPESLTVTFLDSAGGEENTDKRRVESIRTKINELENELRDSEAGRTGDIDIDYKLITENIQLSSANDLLGEQTVSYITEGNGMDKDDWWLKEDHINENLDFARGVVRKRGLGKALYFKSYAEDDELSSVIDLPEKGKVAMIVGLGGGTGSGIMVNIADHIRETMPTAEITVFGVLPNHIEGIGENANAYAALSELEYINLTDRDLFKDFVILPLDATGFGGKTGQRIRSKEQLDEFDEAVAYLFLSYYHTDEAGLEDPFRSSPSYAPFIIGIPQILRYNVEALNESRASIQDIFEKKQEVLESEEEIYGKISRYFDRVFDKLEKGELSEQDKTKLQERVEEIESLLNLDLLEELDYKSRAIFIEIFNEAKEESESIEETIDLLDAQVRAVDTSASDEGRFRGALDEMLPGIFERELKALANRKKLLRQKKSIPDNTVLDTLQYLLSPATDDLPGMKLQRLEGKLEDASERRERLHSELMDVESELEEKLDEQQRHVQEQADSFNRAIRNLMNQLHEFEDLSIHSNLQDLEARLNQFNDNIINAENAETLDNISQTPITKILDQLESEFETVGISIEDDRTRIESSLQELKRAKAALIEMNQEEKWWERLLGPFASGTQQRTEEAHKEYRMVKSQLDDKDVFNLGAPSTTFSSEVAFNKSRLETEYQSRQNDVQGEIVETFKDYLDSPTKEEINRIRDELERGAEVDTILEILEEALKREIEGAEEIRKQKQEIEKDLAEVDHKLELFDSTLKIFENLKEATTKYTEQLEEFNDRLNEYREDTSGTVAFETDDYAHIKSIQPKDTFRATGETSLIESDLFGSNEEVQRLQSNLEELAKNARKQQYTGIQKRKFSEGRRRYEEIKVRVGLSSPAIHDIDPELIDFKSVFSEAFDLGASGKQIENPYTDWQGDFGSDWDIGVSVFIGGIFLDNIRKFVQADGYRSSYERKEGELGSDIIIHHSFGLEDGQYIRRRKILNLEDEDDVGFYLRDSDSDIIEELLSENIEVATFGSHSPLETTENN